MGNQNVLQKTVHVLNVLDYSHIERCLRFKDCVALLANGFNINATLNRC